MKNLDVHVILKLVVFVVLTAALTVLAALKVIPGADAVNDIKALGMTLIGGIAAFGGASKIASALSPITGDVKMTTRMPAPFSRDSQRSTPPEVLLPKSAVVLCDACPHKEAK